MSEATGDVMAVPDPNPVFDLGDPIWINVVGVSETPPDLAPYVGRSISVPSSTTMPPIGTRGILRVSGVNATGYLRNVNGQYEWVLMPAVDPIDALVDSLPGVPWLDSGARLTWLSTARYLRGLGVPSADLDAGLRALWNSEKTELLKEYGVV
jgi:hypothetical protein